MFLEKLIVKSSSKIIREINFRPGLNLVVDETSDVSTDSGNNVGKTTFLRAIDYCLGGPKQQFYVDKEFKTHNHKIFDFLENKNVEFELHLSLNSKTKHRINRPFSGKPSINGIEFSSMPKFCDEIKRILFDFSESRPTLGQLMNKFIRLDEDQINNTLYFLHPTNDKSEYEALFVFLFGFMDTSLLSKKRKILTRIKDLKNKIDGSIYSLENLEQQLHLIERKIEDFEEEKKLFNFNKSVDAELVRLKSMQGKVTELKSLISQINLKISLNQSTLDKLENSRATLSVDAIQLIYKQAKVHLPNLNKQFEEVVIFHNQMVDNKIKFIHSSLEKLLKKTSELKSQLESFLDEESKILKIMSSKGALDEYDKISLRLQDQYREKGNKEALILGLKETVDEFDLLSTDLKKINEVLIKFNSTFDENLKKFNVYFSDYSEKLYSENYFLVRKIENNKTTDNILLDIGNLVENDGTGKKKAQISAFDLAFLKFTENRQDVMPNFVIHDQLDVVYENQIETLFKLANQIEGQFVVAILSDKLKKIPKVELDKSCILKLSQSDKFFKLP